MIVAITEHDSPIHPCLYEDENIQVFVENGAIGWILHAYVIDWSVSAYKKMQAVWEMLIEYFPDCVYAVCTNDKLVKFTSLFGFEQLEPLSDEEGNYIGELMVYEC